MLCKLYEPYETFYNHIFISDASFQVFFCDMSQENIFIEIRPQNALNYKHSSKLMDSYVQYN